jgi:regulator of cell morphogenesis and NO signaling
MKEPAMSSASAMTAASSAALPSALASAAMLPDEPLIRLILQYHDAHVRDLTAALELAERVAQVHGGSGAFPMRLPGELQDMLGELRAHQAREESVLFPAILEGRGASLRLPVSAMSTDHDAAQDRLERLVRLTQDFAPPAEACAAWRRLYDLCRKFDREFRAHVQLEERVLFPRFL